MPTLLTYLQSSNPIPAGSMDFDNKRQDLGLGQMVDNDFNAKLSRKEVG